MNSVLLDTSFLITFANPDRSHHHAARQYFRECIQRQIPMYLSAIVISEFQVKQAINDLPMRNFVVLPFNVDHALRCGILVRELMWKNSPNRRDKPWPQAGRCFERDDGQGIRPWLARR